MSMNAQTAKRIHVKMVEHVSIKMVDLTAIALHSGKEMYATEVYFLLIYIFPSL